MCKSVIEEKTILVKRNARDKIQIVRVYLKGNNSKCTIRRFTGQYQGKMIEQPLLTITKGLASRTVIEQASLQYDSILSKYRDNGYLDLNKLTEESIDEINPDVLNTLVPSITKDANGFVKPMLAKDYNKCALSVVDKALFCSKKLNGVRALFQYSKDEDNNYTVYAVSRGGKLYQESTVKIREALLPFFEKNPSVILDGELYNHGHSLQELSGAARLKKWSEKCEILQYHIYDIVDTKAKFSERLKFLKIIQREFEKTIPGGLVQVLTHYNTTCSREVYKYHDEWVKEGYEGLVARKPTSTYQIGKRGSDMIKIKEYKEKEFEIIDYKDGLRPEDFCFICQTKDGKPFAAKPIGNAKLKEEYLKNIDNIIGKFGTIKYFEWSDEGVPQQPIFQVIRDYE